MKEIIYTEAQEKEIARIRMAAFLALKEYYDFEQDYLKKEKKSKKKVVLEEGAKERLMINTFFKERIVEDIDKLNNESECVFAMSLAEFLQKFQTEVDAHIFSFLEEQLAKNKDS